MKSTGRTERRITGKFNSRPNADNRPPAKGVRLPSVSPSLTHCGLRLMQDRLRWTQGTPPSDRQAASSFAPALLKLCSKLRKAPYSEECHQRWVG